ncbi:class I adenylate-forming enzyme family protein [Bacillus cereus]|nr:class I adenylate-forming enzyme family protein [Bacillus cereus]
MDLIREGDFPLKVLSDIIYYQAKEEPNKVAVIDKNKSYTYKEIFEISWGVSSKLKSINSEVKSIAILSDRSVHYIIAYFATLMAGAMIVPIDKNLTDKEIKETLLYCDVDIIISDNSQLDYSAHVTSNHLFVLQESNFEQYKVEYAEYNVLNNEDETAILLHTSGSVGNPKRVMLTHKGILSNASAHVLHLDIKPEDRALVLLPMHFGYCNTAQIISHFLLGSTLIIMDGIFTPHRLFRMIDKYDVTVFTAVPSMLLQIKDFVHYIKYKRSTVRQITYGGAPFPYEKVQDIKNIFPNANLCETYGLTEAGPRLTAVKPTSIKTTLNSVGTAIPGVEIRIIDEFGKEVNTGKVGQIIAKSPGLMKGYYKNKHKTDEVLKNNWLHTGDLGYLNTEGELFIIGRLKNIIIRAGVNIYPEEIESHMLTYDGIEAIYVHGVSHHIYGEIPCAKIVLNNKNITVEDLIDYAQKRLAKYKIPIFEIVDSLPKTYNNKIKRLNNGVINNETVIK